MDVELLKGVMNCLEPETLAAMVRDLENSRADGQDCLGRPLPDRLQQELGGVIERIVQLGTELTGSKEIFSEMIEEAMEQQEAEWPGERDRQERQNWLEDYR